MVATSYSCTTISYRHPMKRFLLQRMEQLLRDMYLRTNKAHIPKEYLLNGIIEHGQHYLMNGSFDLVEGYVANAMHEVP